MITNNIIIQYYSMLIGYELAHIESAPEKISIELEWPSLTKLYTFPALCMFDFKYFDWFDYTSS